MIKIAITGSKGLIGSRIIELLRGDFEFIELELPEFDITKKDKVDSALTKIDFDIFFHLAAYTNVDGAEKEKDLASLVNIEGTKNILEVIKKRNKQFIFTSTDFVFDGTHPPYDEESIPHPLSYYAKTKYEGELLVKDYAMIVRFSYPYRTRHPSKPDFVKRLKSQLEANNSLSLVSDSIMTPTFIDDIAFSMKYLFSHFSREIFHIVGKDSMSPYDAGRQIARVFDLNESLISPSSFAEYFHGKALRPRYSDIKSKKNNFQQMKTFEEGLKEIKLQMANVK